VIDVMRNLLLCFILTLFLFNCSDNVGKKKTETTTAVDTVMNVTADSNDVSIETINESIVKDSTNVELYIQRAKLYLYNEQVGYAIRDINKALSLDRKNIDALLVLADIYYELGDENNILLTLNKANEYAPLDTRPIIKLAELSFLQGNMQMSSAYLDKALELNKYNPQAYFMRGMICLAKNDTALAIKNFMTSRLQDDTFFDPVIQLAHIYDAQRNPLAKDFYHNAIRIMPDNYSIHYDLALFLQDNGEPEEALALYDTILNAMPDNYYCIYNKGYVNLVYLHDYDKSLELFNRVLEYDPNNLDAQYNIGRIYEDRGDYIKAKNVYLNILKKNSDYQLAVDALQRMGE